MEYEENPWGDERADWRSAMLAATVANRHRDARREQVYKAEDFMPQFGPKQPRRQTAEQMQSIFRVITSTVNQAQKAS